MPRKSQSNKNEHLNGCCEQWCKKYYAWQQWWCWQTILNNSTDIDEIATVLQEISNFEN